MSEYRDNAIENIARQIHKIQIESAKLNDEHSRGIDVYYFDYDELDATMQTWYRNKAIGILEAVPELAIVDRVKPEHLEAYSLDMQDNIKNGWVKEIKE